LVSTRSAFKEKNHVSRNPLIENIWKFAYYAGPTEIKIFEADPNLV